MEDFINKEERKNKAHRKRDRFWKFIFPHYKPSKKLNNSLKEYVVKRTTEQTEKINSLSAYVKHNFSVSLDSELFESILESNDWDSKKAMADMIDYEEASHGILVEPPNNSKVKLLGCENDYGTSCYIDSLLFAMYISNTSFDPLLTYDIPTEEDDKIKLQTIMRLFVNKLRKGHFVNAEYVHWFRKVLRESNWKGQDNSGKWTQEDASELFLFITEIFELPYLPFQIRLFHGANKDSADDRVMTDRTLTLCIPADGDKDNVAVGGGTNPLQLQDILVDYFYNNIITGIRRQVDYDNDHRGNNDNSSNKNRSNSISENVAASPSMATYFDHNTNGEKSLAKDENDTKLLEQTTKINDGEEEEEIAVTAWQVLELLPFYSAMNERGEAIKTQVDSSFPDTHMILPIVLKRYKYHSEGIPSKIKKRVEIPVTIDFNKFVNQNADDPMCPTCGHLIDWTLHFKSAVCHKGDSVLSGHYISYARLHNLEDEEPYWLKLDDINKDSRVTVIKENNATSIYTDLAENAYIVFYELDKTCHHERNSLDLSHSDEEEEGIETKQDTKSIGSNYTHETDTDKQTCTCKNEESTKLKLKSKHHHNYHLKESCKLM